MGSEVSAGRVRPDQVVFREEVVGARVVAGGEVNLGKPKGVVIIFCVRLKWWDGSSARRESVGEGVGISQEWLSYLSLPAACRR